MEAEQCTGKKRENESIEFVGQTDSLGHKNGRKWLAAVKFDIESVNQQQLLQENWTGRIAHVHEVEED